MSSSIYGAALEVEEGETLTLTTTAQYMAVKPGWQEVKMYCASQWRIAHSPKLVHVVKYTAATTTYTEYTTEATDKSSSTHVALDALGTSDCLYLGTNEPVIGYYFDIGSNVNSNDVDVDMDYCSTAVGLGATIAWSNVAGDSDGTDSSGPMAVDGAYTFTLPTSWVRSTLGTHSVPLYTKCYWTRYMVSGALSATVDINEIIPIYQNTNYGYREPGIEYTWTINPNKTGGFVLLATAGTPTLDITWLKHG